MSYRKFTFEQISARFIYESSTGKLYRRLRSGRVREIVLVKEDEDIFKASRVGFSGYFITCTDLIWMLMKKRWPKPGYVIDHRNGDVSDCRWSNLRELTPRQSSWNTDTSALRWVGIKDGLERGVRLNDRGRYRVSISVNGELRNFGTFDTKEEANEVARKVISEVQGEFSFAASRRPRSWRRV
jgi:hypothetical protein